MATGETISDDWHRPAPVAPGQRIGLLDALRGFALLGIFLMNIEWFNRPWQTFGDGLPADATGADYAVGWFVHVFVAGKFWTLFSILFGIGFALMCERAMAAQRPLGAVCSRRLLALFAFGVLHVVLLWTGDILHSYAIAGLLLLSTRNLSPAVQLRIGSLIIVAYCGLALLGSLILFAVPDADPVDPAALALAQVQATEAVRVYAEAGFSAIARQRIADWLMLAGYGLFNLPMLFGVFLVGSWLWRSGRLRDVAAHRRFFVWLAVVGLVSGFALTLAAATVGVSFPGASQTVEPRAMLAQTLSLTGAFPLMLGYLAVFVLVWQCRAGERVLGALVPAGRMALTNYLGQSLVASLVFYGYGLGLYGRWGMAGLVPFAVLVYLLQLVFSRAWLARFRYGPMEWLWRWFTYGRRPGWRNLG